jgi:hypothetical protein
MLEDEPTLIVARTRRLGSDFCLVCQTLSHCGTMGDRFILDIRDLKDPGFELRPHPCSDQGVVRLPECRAAYRLKSDRVLPS